MCVFARLRNDNIHVWMVCIASVLISSITPEIYWSWLSIKCKSSVSGRGFSGRQLSHPYTRSVVHIRTEHSFSSIMPNVCKLLACAAL